MAELSYRCHLDVVIFPPFSLSTVIHRHGIVELKRTPEPLKTELFINRELSLLEFNRRVLEQAKDPVTPLLERLRFLCISNSNLDEFFEIRVARLKEQVASGSVQAGPDNMSPQEILKRIVEVAHRLVEEQYRVFGRTVDPGTRTRQRIRSVRRTEWNAEQEALVRAYFEHELLPVLSPLGLDPSHPFPRVLNKSLNFVVELKGRDAFGRRGGGPWCGRRAPCRGLSRCREIGGGPHDFVFLSSVIHTHVDELFPGMEVAGCYQFRVTRNSELFVDEEEVDDLLRAVEGELVSRRYATPCASKSRTTARRR